MPEPAHGAGRVEVNVALKITDVKARKGAGEKLVMVTAYDCPSARLGEAAGVDMILVGDSVGTNVLGLESEIEVTMEVMLHHARAVARGARDTLLVGDMPFMSYRVSAEQALANAGRMIQEGRMHAVKLEGGEEVAGVVKSLTSAGIPVMGHVGLTPQAVNQLGGYRAQGRDLEGARRLLQGVRALEAAGAFAVVLEAIPHGLATLITGRSGIPTIGIGAGPECDGQVQVLHDIAGWNPDFLPKHSKRYADLAGALKDAVGAYAAEVRAGKFPTAAHSFKVPAEVLEKLAGEDG